MSASVQKVATGDDGAGNELYEYQFGADVDGVFIPFVTKSGGYVDHLVSKGKSGAQADSSSADDSAGDDSGGGDDSDT